MAQDTNTATSPKSRRIILWGCDGDGTLYNGNLHNAVEDKLRDDPEFRKLKKDARTDTEKAKEWEQKVWEVAQEKLVIIGSPVLWKATIIAIRKAGDYFAIISFNDYGNIIFRRHFQENIKLDPAFITENIKIVSYFPPDGNTENKRQRIKDAKKACGLENIPASDIVVIDDHPKNAADARDQGHIVIDANPWGSHVEKMIETFETITGEKVERPQEKENNALFSSSGSEKSPRSGVSESMANFLRGGTPGTPCGTPPLSGKSPRSGSTTPFKSSCENLMLFEQMEGRRSPGIN